MQWWTRQQLGSRDPKRRRAALEKFAQDPSPFLEPLITAALDDADTQVRLAAVEAVAKLSPDCAVSCLIRTANHRDPAVRERIVQVLPRFNKERVLEPLRQALRDRHDSVRTAAGRALEQLDWHPQKEEEEAEFAVAHHDFMGAAQCGAAAIEPLLVVLADASYNNRRLVVLALSELGDTRTTKALIAAARDPDPTVRVVAIEGLGRLSEATATDCIRAALRDSNANVRMTAAESIGKLLDTGALDMLVLALRDAHWEVRKASIEALGKLKDQRALEPLLGRLGDTDHDARLAAVEALGQLETPGAIEALVRSLVDPHAPVRRASENALRRSDPHWEQSTGAQRATPKLKAALSANDYVVRQAAADTLMKIGAAATVERAPAALSHAAVNRRQAALEVFTECLNHADRDLRLAAVEALGRIRDPAAHSAIREVASDPDEDTWVRAAAESILPGLIRGQGGQMLPGLSEADQAKIVPLVLWDGEIKQRSNTH